MPTTRSSSAAARDGFTLIEVLVGLLLVSAVVAGTSHLLVATVAALRDAREEGAATLLAIERLEQLSAALAAGAPPIPAPVNALDADEPGWNDRVAAGGGSAAGQPSGPVFVRRWRVSPISSSLPLWRIEVRVLALRAAGVGTAAARRPGEAMLSTVRSAP